MWKFHQPQTNTSFGTHLPLFAEKVSGQIFKDDVNGFSFMHLGYLLHGRALSTYLLHVMITIKTLDYTTTVSRNEPWVEWERGTTDAITPLKRNSSKQNLQKRIYSPCASSQGPNSERDSIITIWSIKSSFQTFQSVYRSHSLKDQSSRPSHVSLDKNRFVASNQVFLNLDSGQWTSLERDNKHVQKHGSVHK